MDDLTQQLNQILSDPQQMQQLQAMAGALGLGGNPAPQAQQPSPQAPAAPPPAQPALPAMGMDAGALQMVSRITPLLSQLQQEDDSTRLLRALRPLLSEPRRRKLDEAARLLQMLRLLPLLRGSGLF